MAQKFTVPITVKQLASAGSDAVTVYVDADTQARLKIEAGGRLTWGSGSVTGDVNLYRDSADVLKTDDTFQVPALFVDSIEVDTTGATTNQVLKFDGTKFAPGTASTVGSIDDLSDVVVTSPALGDVLKYNGSLWTSASASGAGLLISATAPAVTDVLWADTSVTGVGVVPVGGTTGQMLAKSSSADYDAAWATPVTSSDLALKAPLASPVLTGIPEAPTAAVGTSTTQLATTAFVTTAASNVTSGFRNVIINGGFDVWQRSTSATTTGADSYASADRWRIRTANGGGSILSSRQSASLAGFQYCMRFQRVSGNTDTGVLQLIQTLETPMSVPLAGRDVTVSFWARKGANYSPTSSALKVYLQSGTSTDAYWLSFTGSANLITQTTTLTSTWQKFSFTAAAGSTATQFYLQFEMTPTGTAGANDYFEITGVQLEANPQATPFEQRPYDTELTLCQRYFERQIGMFNLGYTQFNSAVYSGRIPLRTTKPMRSTVSVAAIVNGNVYNTASATDTAIGSWTFGSHNTRGAIGVTDAGFGGTNGALLRNDSSTFDFSAEL